MLAEAGLFRVAMGLLIVGAAGTGISILVGMRIWDAATRSLDAEMRTTRARSTRLEALPDIVSAYLARSIPHGAAPISMARFHQDGEFQMGEGDHGWKPFTAVEVFNAPSPDFYWDARIQMAPLMTVRVRDSYVGGRGRMLGRIAALFAVVDIKGSDDPSLSAGALTRYLAEAAWFPTRLASGPGLSWASLGPLRAQATLAHRGTRVSMDFTFTEDGDPVSVQGQRPRAVDAGFIDTPWVGRFTEHSDFGGFRIPACGEVGWIIEGVEKPYWRGRIIDARFEFVDDVGH